MKAACVLPAPDGLTEDLMNKAVYELNKLGRITDSPITGGGRCRGVYCSLADEPGRRFEGDAVSAVRGEPCT